MPNQKVFQAVLREISKGYAEYEYFFNKLDAPEWLQPLAENSFFKEPPGPIRDEQYISFPLWPERRGPRPTLQHQGRLARV